MNERLTEFANHHAASREPRVTDLLTAVRRGQVKFRSFSEDISSSELAKTYQVRSSVASSNGRHALAEEMRTLSKHCEANADNPCAIWVFEGAEFSYALFELLPSRVVAACFKFEGSFGIGAEHAPA
jgi:hypothetical protein